MVYLVSDKKTEYSEFMAQTLEELENYNVRGIAIVALTNGDENLTGFWNMDLRDRVQAESELRFDVFDVFMQSNIDRYIDITEEDYEEG